jgi:hypothetical protein
VTVVGWTKFAGIGQLNPTTETGGGNISLHLFKYGEKRPRVP